jgi:N-glycosylase/DNA lyase
MCCKRFITSSANNVPRITSLVHRLCYHFSPLLLTLPAPGYATHSETEGDIVPYISYHLFPRPTDLLRGSKPVGQAETSTDVADGSLIDRLQQTLRELGFGYRAGFISSSLQTLVAAHGTPEERSLLGLPRDLDDPQMDEGGVEGFLLSLRQGHESSVGVTSVENKYAQRWRTELLRLKGVGRKVADCIGLMSLDQVSDNLPREWETILITFFVRPMSYLSILTYNRLPLVILVSPQS